MAEHQEVTCQGCEEIFVPETFCGFLPSAEDPKVGHCEACVMEGKTGDNTILIPEKRAIIKCKRGHREETCRYLLTRADGWHCAKGSSMEKIINARAHKMHSKGDNCSGHPEFKKH